MLSGSCLGAPVVFVSDYFEFLKCVDAVHGTRAEAYSCSASVCSFCICNANTISHVEECTASTGMIIIIGG